MTTHYDPYPRQAAAPVARAYAPARPRSPYLAPAAQPEIPEGQGLRVDALALAALLIAAFFIFQTVRDRVGQDRPQAEPIAAEKSLSADNASAADVSLSQPEAAEVGAQEAAPAEEIAAPPPAIDPWAISYPYDEYWLTQGPHGFSYGHMAIDLAAGKGEPVKSPIHGQVTALYVDEYGNTTLVIENDVYAVTLLHGNYSVQVGQQVSLGEVVGSEWNNGYTLDSEGRSCRDRDCGYHTHLNVFSKASQSNVNPLDVLR